MWLFGKKEEDDEPDIYDEDEIDELLIDSALYFDTPELRDMSLTIYPKDIYRLDTDALLESIEQLPYEFRCYLDTRRAFSNALVSCREQISDYVSYEGGRSAEYSRSFEYDDKPVSITFTLSRDSDNSPFAFTVDIKTE
ncbi:MAG: hypothetical protein II820_01930 [Ruminiclostridium sp.]|nr:hypothetical protein [Ruminiclostridium sp.]